MADVFISYSRKNSSFVKNLCAALGERSFDVWVDIDGLFAGEEFWPEVARAIDGAVVVVFVMTPHSLESSACRDELEHAVAAGKRLVPVCRGDMAGLEIPRALAMRQWVFYRPEDYAREALASLESAILANWEALRLQAQLYAQAQDWRMQHEDPSRLLRGRQLREAEAWLTRVTADGHDDAEESGDSGGKGTSDSKSHADEAQDAAAVTGPGAGKFVDDSRSFATPLHIEFLAASRTAVRRRRQRLLATTFVVVIVLLLVTWYAMGYYVAELANRHDYDTAASQENLEQAVEGLKPAVKLCTIFRQRFAACPWAAYNLGMAVLGSSRSNWIAGVADSRLQEAIRLFGVAIETATPRVTGQSADTADRALLGNAHQARAYAQVLVAETLDAPGRKREYAAAEKDVIDAREIYAEARRLYIVAGQDEEASKLEEVQARFAVLQARILIATGAYEEGLAVLQGEASWTWAPERELLLSLGYRCIEQLEKADKHLRSYMKEEVKWHQRDSRRPADLRAKMGMTYYKRVAERCAMP